MLNQTILTVSQLNQRIRLWLEQDIGPITVKGEISSVTKPASGHYYFTLKDSGAQLSCVYFRNRWLANPNITPEHGQQVMAYGTLSLYEARGDYQLIINSLEEAGAGDLYYQFEQLKEKLSQEGLFAAQHKKPLPRIPHSIGVITSPTAAALRDILITLARRFPLAPVVIYPSDVQGKEAPRQLVNAIQRANTENRCNILLLARGGGSLEDLWAFNDEALARAIYNSKLPIVSGIGHETDFTIADFVADHRAATPTAAAEAISPDHVQLQALCTQLNMTMQQIITRQLESSAQTLDYLLQHLHKNIQHILVHKQQKIQLAQHSLECQHPNNRILMAKKSLNNLEEKLCYLIQTHQIKAQERLRTLCATLHAISPLATLDRGYAIAMYKSHVLTNSKSVNIGDTLVLKLAKGQLSCSVLTQEHACEAMSEVT